METSEQKATKESVHLFKIKGKEVTYKLTYKIYIMDAIKAIQNHFKKDRLNIRQRFAVA